MPTIQLFTVGTSHFPLRMFTVEVVHILYLITYPHKHTMAAGEVVPILSYVAQVKIFKFG